MSGGYMVTSSNGLFSAAMWKSIQAMLRSPEGRGSILTYAAEGISVLGMVLVYRLASEAGKDEFDQYVVARRTVSFLYPLILVGTLVGLTRFVAMRTDVSSQVRYLRGALTWVVPMAIGLMLVCLVVPGGVAWVIYGSTKHAELSLPLGLMIAGISLHGVAYSFLRGQHRLVLANFIQVMALAVTPCLAFVMFTDLIHVMWATGIAWTLFAVLSVLPTFFGAAVGPTWKERGELLRYGLPRVPGDLAFGALLTIPVYVVARMQSDTGAGIAVDHDTTGAIGEVGFGAILLNLAAAVFSPLALILLPASASQLASGDYAGLEARIQRLTRLSLLGAGALMIGFEVLAEPLLRLQLGDNYADYVPMGRLMFLGALPFGFFIAMRSVLDAYYHTPRNGINLMTAFAVLMVGCLVPLFIVTSSPMAVGVVVVVSLYYLGWATWRDVRYVRSELHRLGKGEEHLRILVVIPAREDQQTAYPFVRRQAAAFSRDHGAHVRVFHLPSRTSPWRLWRERGRLKRVLREERPDVVHVHYGSVGALFTVLSSSVPVVITFLGSDLNRTPQDGFFRDLLGRTFSQLAAFFSAGIICVSEPLRQLLWWRQNEAVVLPTAVDAQRFKPMDRAACRQQLGWTGEERVVLFNANNPGVKRLDIAEAAIALLQAKGMPVRLEALKGSFDPARVPILMNACDALLLCSDREGSPTMVKEAMACGLPVVSNDVGDVVERTRGVEPGAIAAQEPEALAAALEEVLKDGRRSNGPELLQRNGVDARSVDEATYAYLRSVLIR
jgi:teichuronic acid biosynthesis glycosyltransferase TuaC